MENDLNLLRRCDAIYMLNGWEQSLGAVEEYEFAVNTLKMPVYYEPDEIPLNPVEIESPSQCSGYIEQVMAMYRLHLKKNHDYSPSNILGTGGKGIVTRIWDKTVRLMNLLGFSVVIQERKLNFKQRLYALFTGKIQYYTIEQREIKQPKNESIDDTFIDLSSYGIIGMLERAGKWGK